jgi:hypothetical protein
MNAVFADSLYWVAIVRPNDKKTVTVHRILGKRGAAAEGGVL